MITDFLANHTWIGPFLTVLWGVLWKLADHAVHLSPVQADTVWELVKYVKRKLTGEKSMSRTELKVSAALNTWNVLTIALAFQKAIHDGKKPQEALLAIGTGAIVNPPDFPKAIEEVTSDPVGFERSINEAATRYYEEYLAHKSDTIAAHVNATALPSK